LAYALMNLGAFAVVVALARKGEFNEELDDFAGLGFKRPFLGATMTIFMLSLAGIPTLAGFTGKLFLFSAAVKAGYIGLAVIGVLNSVVSMYYYAGVLVRMYMTEGDIDPPALSHRPHIFAALLITASGTVLLGIFPGWAFDLALSAFRSLG
jgi:NADH-quinone oxidoreductase subunit N